MRQTLEAYERTEAVIFIKFPAITDVVFGRSKPKQGHLVNLRLKIPITWLTTKKTKISGYIVQTIKSASSGRFSTRESGLWAEISDELARERVSHIFHNRKKARVEESKQQSKLISIAESIFGKPRSTTRTSILCKRLGRQLPHNIILFLTTYETL